MPIMVLHLPKQACSQNAIAKLLGDASNVYCDALYPGVEPRPIDRVRILVLDVDDGCWATGGKLVSNGGVVAPYFTLLTLAGRPREQIDTLMNVMTDLIVQHLGCERGAVRGRVDELDPANWYIGGQPASSVRALEASRRAVGFKS